MRKELRARPPRLALAAALWLAAAGANGAGRDPFAIDMPAGVGVGGCRGVAALMHGVRAVAATQHRAATPQHVAAVRPVTDCGDDNGPGTLRSVLANVASGDTVDLSALTCSTITLTQGALGILPDDVTLAGPGADRLALVGNGQDRLMIHYGYGTLTLRDLTVRDGVISVGGYKLAGGACILAANELYLVNTTVTGCVATGEGAYGGAILASQVTLVDSTLRGNVAQGSLLKTLTAAYGGGAFAYQGQVELFDSTVTGNRAVADPANSYGRYDVGGGLFADLGGLLYTSTVDNNVSDGTGGGFGARGGVLVFESTLSGNSAGTRGGGLFVRGGGEVVLDNSTVAFNRAAVAGGGVYVATSSPSLLLQSTIVADNSAPAGADIASYNAVTATGSNNIVLGAGPNVTLPAGTLRSDPLLAPLAINGGPTRTHALSPGSPAIDRGSNAVGLAFDQRGVGFPRVIGPAPDIGAFEAGASAAPSLAAVPGLSPIAVGMLAFALLCAASRRRCKRM